MLNIFTNPLMTGHLFIAIKHYLEVSENFPSDGSTSYGEIEGSKVEIANCLLDQLGLPLRPDDRHVS